MANISTQESLSISLKALWANKLRSFLTLLGIIIGVMTVIAIISIISGLNNYVETKLFNMGSHDFTLNRMPSIITSFEEWKKYSKRKKIEYEDHEAVKKYCTSCHLVGARASSSGTVKYKDKYLDDVRISGYTENDTEILGNLELESGRSFQKSDLLERMPVAIIGWDLREQLFPGIDPIGKTFWAKQNIYRVIGVGEKKGKVLGMSQDNYVIVPLTTFFKDFGARRRNFEVTVSTKSPEAMESAQEEVRQIIRSRRKLMGNMEDDFAIETQETFMDFYRKTTGALYIGMVVISSISLLVGGIVIMNIMLVSVTERVKEIGLRKAIGARRRDILFQFLIEALMLSFIGGLLGILLGFSIAKAITAATGFPSSVELWSILTGLAIAGVVGLFAGIYPANKAAKLDPVIAIRME